jgi:hypothetical protein
VRVARELRDEPPLVIDASRERDEVIPRGRDTVLDARPRIGLGAFFA